MNTLDATLNRFQLRRRFPNWQPTPPTSAHHMPEATVGFIQRMTELLDLEVTVGLWITDAIQALSAEDQRTVVSYVYRNSTDEAKHDSTLRYLSKYVGTPEVSQVARELINDWQKQQPSFALAYALEMGVFMSILPWLTKHGDMYCVKCAQWIADDEGVHVLTNRELAHLLGQPITLDHARLVKRTLSYIFPDNSGAVVQRAIRRLQTGEDSAMMNESVAITPAFFEQHDKRSIKY